MPYIGRGTDKLSNVEVLDNITFDGSSSYTLQKGGSNFTPSSANNILISIDGVVQAGNFTVSGSTIDFGTAVAGTSTCDFILHYGIGLITTVSDGTVTTAKLADSSVSLAKLTATGTKDATTFLRGDNTFASAGTQAVLGTKTQQSTGSVNVVTSGTTVFGDICGGNIVYTPSSNSSKLIVTVSTGLGAVNFANDIGYGLALSLSQSGGLSVTNDRRSLYGWFGGITSAYGNDMTMVKVYDNSSTNQITVTGKGYIYSEGSSATVSFAEASLTLLEVTA